MYVCLCVCAYVSVCIQQTSCSKSKALQRTKLDSQGRDTTLFGDVASVKLSNF